MSFRRRKRELEQLANKKLEKIELKKRALNKTAGKNLFETERIDKKFGPVRYEKAGLKIAPAITISLWIFRISFRSIRLSLSETSKVEWIIITLWRLKILINNWAVRGKEKPRGSIGNYLITINTTNK